MATTETLPIIELSKETMERGTSGWVSTMQAIRTALEDYGCFEATYNEIEPKTNDDLLRALQDLFKLDLETKHCFSSEAPFEGYSRREDPPYEAMGIYDPLALCTIESFVRCLFPQGNVQIRDTIHLYVTKIWELEKVVRRMVYESFGVEEYFEEQERSMQYYTRLTKYEAGSTKESRGKELRPHYDTGFLTILHEYGANGLQVKARNRDQWTRVKLSGSSFLVMAGESFFGWSNGRVQCALHRVKMSEDEESRGLRYSIGLFSGQKGVVRILNEVVDEMHPMQIKPFDEKSLVQVVLKHKETPRDYNDDHIVPTIVEYYTI